MRFWSGTPVLDTTDTFALVRMLDEAGYHGVLTADHLIYLRQLTSPYPDGSDKPPWAPETAWPDSRVMVGAMAAARGVRTARSILRESRQAAQRDDSGASRVVG